jgi:chorismate synthase
MKVTCVGSMRGQKMYAVVEGSDRMFTGTLEEVKRYLDIRRAKIAEREAALQAHRDAMRRPA